MEELEQQLRRERAKGKRAELNPPRSKPSNDSQNLPAQSTHPSRSYSRGHTADRLSNQTPSGSGTGHDHSTRTAQPPASSTEAVPIHGSRDREEEMFDNAVMLQLQFDEEDRRLRQQMSELAQQLIKKRAKTNNWSITSFPAHTKFKLPADIFRPLPNSESANKVSVIHLPGAVWIQLFS